MGRKKIVPAVCPYCKTARGHTIEAITVNIEARVTRLFEKIDNEEDKERAIVRITGVLPHLPVVPEYDAAYEALIQHAIKAKIVDKDEGTKNLWGWRHNGS